METSRLGLELKSGGVMASYTSHAEQQPGPHRKMIRVGTTAETGQGSQQSEASKNPHSNKTGSEEQGIIDS